MTTQATHLTTSTYPRPPALAGTGAPASARGNGAAVAASWLTILVSFTLDYVRTDARHGWSLLDYPEAADGLRGARIDDYLYFATSVSTTFGTTDVTVRGSLMRRRVAVHGIIAFVFNTTVIAVVVNAMSALGS